MSRRLQPWLLQLLVATLAGCFQHDLSSYYDAAAGFAFSCTPDAAETGCQTGGVCVPASSPTSQPTCARRCDPAVADGCGSGLTCDGDSGLCLCGNDTACQLAVNGAATCDPTSHLCVCQPNCDGRECGPDGCGGYCGLGCDISHTCDYATGMCVDAFCGVGAVVCPSGAGCPMHSICLTDGCHCDSGYQTVFCNGQPCTGRDCVGVAYYCAPIPD